jgi:hypothetical protein
MDAASVGQACSAGLEVWRHARGGAIWTAEHVGSALIAGLLFAFSTSVMKALSQLPPEQGWPPCRTST